MPLAYQDVPSRLRQKTCLVCGYNGPELQGDAGDDTYRCPACDADLYARPPQSYAELEGFTLAPETPAETDPAGSAAAEIKARRALPLWFIKVIGLLRPARRRATRV